MNNPTPPAWLPDWADDTAYPTRYEDWDLEQWGWAFLRRNAEYQSDYARFDALPECWPDTGTKTPKWSCRGMMEGWSMDFRYCDPPALPGETYREYWERNNGLVVEEMPLEAYLMNKWTVLHLPDPASDDGGGCVNFAVQMLPPDILRLDPPDVSGWVPPMPDPDQPENITLRFDVRFNIERQIKEAEAILYDHYRRGRFDRIKAATPDKAKLHVYLRAFDASLAGVGPRELAGKICSSKRNDPSSLRSADEEARRAIKAGKSLVDMGYKNLLRFG